MTLSEELQWRGFVNQTTLRDITELDSKQFTFYWGVDPSADSMTVGNFAAGMMARHFMQHGHKAVLLVGGATGMIGDPDGKAEERQLKTLDEITKNKAGISEQYRRIFSGMDFELVDNYDWFKDIKYLDFLRDIGKHFSMTQLLDRDFIKSRIGEGGKGISYAEFSYSLIQGYDFLHLFRTHGVNMQLCGADQWGNSISGVDLIRKLEAKEAHIWSTPLVMNKATGKKFGKSEDGAVWLSSEKTSVYKFYQFWLNVDDEGVIDYMKVYTLLPKEEIERLEQATKKNPGAREAQKTLAREVTQLVHGEARVRQVEHVTEVLFGSTQLTELSSEELAMLANEIPTINKDSQLISALVEGKIAKSNGEARRFIESGAISLNGKKMSKDAALGEVALIKKGKNTFILVK
jgi:tyrosyl-tRNA synthetase